MPERLARRWVSFAGRHDELIILALCVALVVALIFAVLGWNKATDAQRRVTSVETQLETERIGKAIADVTTCFNQARVRPRLIKILRGIQVELEPDPRQALGDLIDEYDSDTPSTADCVILARKRGVDPRPYVQNPPSQAGTPR